MTITWPPQNADEMLVLQHQYGRDDDIAAALGVVAYTVERCRQKYKLPTLPQSSWRPVRVVSEEAIAEMFAGRRYR